MFSHCKKKYTVSAPAIAVLKTGFLAVALHISLILIHFDSEIADDPVLACRKYGTLLTYTAISALLVVAGAFLFDMTEKEAREK